MVSNGFGSQKWVRHSAMGQEWVRQSAMGQEWVRQ